MTQQMAAQLYLIGLLVLVVGMYFTEDEDKRPYNLSQWCWYLVTCFFMSLAIPVIICLVCLALVFLAGVVYTAFGF